MSKKDMDQGSIRGDGQIADKTGSKSVNIKNLNPYGNRGFIGMPREKAKNSFATVKRLAMYLKPHAAKLCLVFIFMILSTVFNIIGPKVLGMATTGLMDVIEARVSARKLGILLPSVDFPFIGSIALFLIALYGLSSFSAYFQQYIMVAVSQKTILAMRNDVNAKLALLPLKYFDTHPHGEIMSRVTNDIDRISSSLQESLTAIIASLFTIAGVVVIMLSISPLLTLFAIILLPLSFLGTAAIARQSKKYFSEQQKELGVLNSHIEEMYTGHLIVRAFCREKKAIDDFNKINNRLFDAGWRAQFVSGVIFPMMNFINNIGYVVMCVAGGIYAARRMIAIGDVQAFIQYSKHFTYPVLQIANIFNILQSALVSAERVFELMDEEEEIPDCKNGIIPGDPKGDVKFQQVKFSYTEGMSLIENLNIDVRQGQTIAIVGPTGAGKTTLVNLLMRFYELHSGRIAIDGVDIRNYARASLRLMFGMVLQDTWLFHGTIKENIAYGKAGASDEEIIRAARIAHADHFIRILPRGYDTVLNDDASNISQGEKQLLTIARAILADPRILILDEATSHVDTRTEAHIRQALKELRKGRTSFIIAHRLPTIRDADVILVMNNGAIVETGNHPELIAKGGFYARLYNSQFTVT